MSKKFNKSILVQGIESVLQEKDFTKAKQAMIDIVSASEVKTKEQMLRDITPLKTLYQIQKYCCNALLKFEGMGVSIQGIKN